MVKLTKRKQLRLLTFEHQCYCSCRVYFWHKPSTQCANLKRAKSVSTFGSTSPGSSLLIPFPLDSGRTRLYSSYSESLPRGMLMQRSQKSFHIYEAHTWAQRHSWVPRELGEGDRGELRMIQSARDAGRGSHCAAKGADSISAATRGHFTRRVRVLTRAERRDRSRRTAPPLVSPSSPGPTHGRTQSWLGGDNVRRHENQTRRTPPASVVLNWLGKVRGRVAEPRRARLHLSHSVLLIWPQ